MAVVMSVSGDEDEGEGEDEGGDGVVGYDGC